MVTHSHFQAVCVFALILEDVSSSNPFNWHREPRTELDEMCCPVWTKSFVPRINTDHGSLLKSDGYTQWVQEQRCLVDVDRPINRNSYARLQVEEGVDAEARRDHLYRHCGGGRCRQEARHQSVLFVNYSAHKYALEIKTILVPSECFFVPPPANTLL